MPDRRDRRLLFSGSSERHWQSGVNEIAKVSKRPQQDSNQRPLDCQSHALTTEPPCPTTEHLAHWFRVSSVYLQLFAHNVSVSVQKQKRLNLIMTQCGSWRSNDSIGVKG